MLTERMMKAAIWDLVRNGQQPDDLRLDLFDEPWAAIYRSTLAGVKAGEDPDTALDKAIQETDLVDHGSPSYWERLDAVIEDIQAAASRRRRYRSFGEMKRGLAPVEWHWCNWIPKGMISLVGGFPGTGKSYWVLDLVRSTIHGGTWPDGTPVKETGPVIWIEGEGIPQVVMAREEALKIDDSQLFMLLASEGQVLDLASLKWRDELAEMVNAVRPRLIVVDSLRSVVTNSTDRPEQVNPLLQYLAGVARFANCGMILVHHLRKPQGSQLAFPLVTIHDFAGSQHIVAMSRTVIGLSVMQNGNGFTLQGPRRVDVCKTFADYPTALGVELLDGQEGCKRFKYGEPPTVDSAPVLDDCKRWLLDALEEAGEPMKASELIRMGEEEGKSRAAIFRAREALEGTIVDTVGPKQRLNRWALASWQSDVSLRVSESHDSDEAGPAETVRL